MTDEIEALKLALEKLPNDEARSQAIAEYLVQCRDDGSLERLEEGSVAALVNLLPLQVRATFVANTIIPELRGMSTPQPYESPSLNWFPQENAA